MTPPATKIIVAQPDLLIFYRLVAPDGLTVAFQATPLTPDVAGAVIGSFTEDYVLVTMLIPTSTSWAFLRQYLPDTAYTEQKLEFDPRRADLMSRLLPLITVLAPADLLAEAADRWYYKPTA